MKTFEQITKSLNLVRFYRKPIKSNVSVRGINPKGVNVSNKLINPIILNVSVKGINPHNNNVSIFDN